jgi:acyl carrier protein
VSAQTGELTSSEVLDVVRDALTIVLELDPATIDRATVLAEVGADSLARVAIADVVEQELSRAGSPHLHIPDDDLGSVATAGDLVDHVMSLL